MSYFLMNKLQLTGSCSDKLFFLHSLVDSPHNVSYYLFIFIFSSLPHEVNPLSNSHVVTVQRKDVDLDESAITDIIPKIIISDFDVSVLSR